MVMKMVLSSNILGSIPATRRRVPHLSRFSRDAPDFLYAGLDRAACAPFFQGKGHEVSRWNASPQEIG